jgi:2-oxoisovalerate dehydrogenase E2 component (dihydrolipoyl transacylase)
LAKKEGVDISQVPATGKNGRVTKGDVLNYIKTGGVSQPAATRQEVHSSTSGGTFGGYSGPKIAALTDISEQDTVKRITGMKKAMTKTMTESLTIPFFTFSDEIDATRLIALRKEMKKVHTNLTILPFFIKACSIAMTEYPVINSHIDNDWDEEGYIQRYVIKHDHNFSIAIDSKEGLTVPNIKKIQDKSILQINDELVNLRHKTD